VRKLIELEPRLAVHFSGDGALAKQALAAAQEAASIGKWPEAFQRYEQAYAWMTGETEKDRADVEAILTGLRRAYAKLATKPELPGGGTALRRPGGQPSRAETL
jgi:predicted Zn-dependent protease